MKSTPGCATSSGNTNSTRPSATPNGTSPSPGNCTTRRRPTPRGCGWHSSTPFPERASRRNAFWTLPGGKTLPTPLLPLYYETYNRLFGHYAAISYQKKYDRQAALYGDSLMMVLDPASYAYRSNRAGRLIGQGRLDEAQSLLTELLGEIETNTPHYAEITYAFGSLFQKRHDDRLALKYYVVSAIADIRNATKENASLQALARMSYAAGDLSDAFKYAQAAIDDALFSNVQFRTAQMAEFYSIINASYQAKEARSKSTLQHYMLLISLLSVVLALLFAYLYKQLRKLSRTKEELSQANLRLTQLNDELNDKNAQLSDSNDLKEQYIARFFDLCSLYIDKMDSYRKTLNRLAQNRQFDELFKRLKSTSMMENEFGRALQSSSPRARSANWRSSAYAT